MQRDGERRDGRLRVLLIAEAANPELVSVPLEGWSHSRAIAGLTHGHLVTQVRNRAAILRAGMKESDGGWGEFTAIDSERVARPLWKAGTLIRGGAGKGWTTTTAINAISYYYFERLVWKRFGGRIRGGAYDVVHRLTPLSPTVASLIAGKCRRAGVPFVMGPLNGGVKWPKAFDKARRKEKEWLSYVRDAYKLMPGYRATRENAAAIIIGSMDTFEQMDRRYHGKSVYIPENAIEPERFTSMRRHAATKPLRVVFVGRLVPYKGPDMLIEACAPLVRSGAMTLEVIGDGPMMGELKELVVKEHVTAGVTLSGWVEHAKLHDVLALMDVFAFPSIREFGGAAVLEAMAVGLVPVVVGYGGPAELVTDQTGVRVGMGSRAEIVTRFRVVLEKLCASPGEVDRMSLKARERATSSFTWRAKALQVLEVYRWVTGQRPDKPDFGMPLPDVAARQQLDVREGEVGS